MRFLTSGTANLEERADKGHKSDTEVGLRLRGGGDVSSGEDVTYDGPAIGVRGKTFIQR